MNFTEYQVMEHVGYPSLKQNLFINANSYHSPTRNPIAARNPMMPTKVEKWHTAADSVFITQTSICLSCIKNHPDDETHPNTIIEKS